jgi:hypothetical protein
VTAVLLSLAPLLALMAALLARRYPGERAIARLRAQLARPRRRACAPAAGPRARRRTLPRGGRLAAAAIAARPPPGRMPDLTFASIRRLQGASP